MNIELYDNGASKKVYTHASIRFFIDYGECFGRTGCQHSYPDPYCNLFSPFATAPPFPERFPERLLTFGPVCFRDALVAKPPALETLVCSFTDSFLGAAERSNDSKQR